MRTCLVFLCLLAATFALSVKNKPHGKHHGLHKASHTAKEKDVIKEETNEALILPTLATFVANSPEPENEELSPVDNKDDEEVTEKREKSTAVLLSEEELVDLLKKEAEEEEEAEERELEEEEEEVEADKGNVESREGEEMMGEEKTFDDISETREEEEVKEESEDEGEEVMSHMEEPVGKMADRVEQVPLLEESEGSTESEILADLDYAADSGTIQSLQTDNTTSISKTDVVDAKEKEATEKELTGIVDDYGQDVQNTETKYSEEVSDQGKDKDSLVSSKETSASKKEPEANVDLQDQKSSEELDLTRLSGKEEEKNKDNSGSHTRGKTRKQKKNKRVPQRDEAPPGLEEGQQDSPESEDTDNTVQKAKRRREGKWIKNKPHGKHHGLHKASHTAKEKDVIKEETNEALILPTLATFVANSPEPENEELSSVDKKDDEEVTKKREKSTAELLSEEELVDLLKKEAEEEEEVEKRELEEEEEEEEVETDKGNVEMSHMEESDGKMADREEQMPLLVLQDQKSSEELDLTRLSGKEEDKNKNNSGSQTRGKTKKQKKNKRAMKHSLQSDEAPPGLEESQQDSPVSEDADNTVQKAKRRREGKWGPLVGMNPVQIRATADLYPSTRVSLGGRSHLSEDHADPCDDFRCKRGKTCKLDADNKPQCVCQEPSDCLSSMNEFDHVCGTDNNTYDTSCELFATKCKLEGTKKGHRLHLDYTGACKLIPPCLDTELVQFPLRMRDWLKNVLLQLYEHDSVSHGFLTSKQRFRVRKIFESVRRLHAGNHSVDLLAQDFEKNYNMYIYPVHWQFAQLDQHPSDRFLSHSELAPLRVPLVPMEHCTSTFFQECDADKDKQVSFKEWTSCFGIRNEDMDVSLLF